MLSDSLISLISVVRKPQESDRNAGRRRSKVAAQPVPPVAWQGSHRCLDPLCGD